MNKEEVKKAIKALICSQIGKCYFPKRRNCRTCLEQNRRIIKNYIKELEQKETILDKVKDKLKEDIDIYINSKELTQKEQIELDYAKEILNIIEGENK